MSLLRELLAFEARSAWEDQTDDYDQNSQGELMRRVARACKVTTFDVSVLFYGGPTGYEQKFVKHGYKLDAESYDDNLEFWKRCGISEADFDYLLSQG